MSLNPNEESLTESGDRYDTVGFESAEVVTAPTHVSGDNVGHHVEVIPDKLDEPVTADVRVDQSGDVAIPTEGERVIIGYRTNSRPIVLGTRYSLSDDIPEFEPGERVIGHSLTDGHIRLDTDGTITVTAANDTATITIGADGTIQINDGQTKPITDVETTTDGDGHVTDITVTRSNNVYLPE